MNNNQFQIIRGIVSDLRVTKDGKNFVFTGTDKAAGGAAAIGLAVGGLAGAATGAAMSSGDTADAVDFFICKVGEKNVKGQFGTVNFANGDNVEAVGAYSGDQFEAYALTRPADRTIWMYPHSGKGTQAYVRSSLMWIFIICWLISPLTMFGIIFFSSGNLSPLWVFMILWLLFGLIGSAIFGFVAWRFMKFARISDAIFAALDFDDPPNVDLSKRLRAASRDFSNEERWNYHPHSRWVYKY